MMTAPYVEVNNNAVQLLRCGNYEAALPTFLVALDHFKQTVAASVLKEMRHVDSNIGYGNGTISSHEARMARRKDTEQIPRDESFYQSWCFLNDELTTKTAYDRLHLFSRAFALSDRPEDDPSATNRRDGTSSLILFNIGVTLHAQSIRTGDTQIMEKALTAYQLALSSAEYWALHSGGECNLLQMSILNNMALLYSQKMQAEEATSCLQALQLLVIESTDLGVEDRNIYDWNIILFMQGRLEESPAPAA